MNYALYLNGVFESVLEEICAAQADAADLVCFLQPYKADRIVRFVESPPSQAVPVQIYISLTSSLAEVRFKAEVVGWENKSELSHDRLADLNQHIKKYQPNENDIYFKKDNGEPCVNLVAIRRLERLTSPIHVSSLVKLSNGEPLKVRTRAGSWSYVRPIPSWVGALEQTAIESEIKAELNEAVKRSSSLSSSARAARLQNAPKLPEVIQIISKGYRRNPDVVAEVLKRASGNCEECENEAPFIKASDGSPYLEVHHVQMLSARGEDTVENAIAVCPNCHKRLHYGV